MKDIYVVSTENYYISSDFYKMKNAYVVNIKICHTHD